MLSKIWLRNVCRNNQFEISDANLDLLERYANQLIAWNSKVNLISRRDIDNIWHRHIISSISFLFKFQFESPARILDLGTGGGLPGIPIAILQPALHVTLLDSIQKKVHAVRNILDHLSLQNVSIVAGRAEQICHREEFQASFDYVIARAVATIDDIITWAVPFLKRKSSNTSSLQSDDQTRIIPRGSILMLKGGELTREISRAQKAFPDVKIFSYPILVEGVEPNLLPDKKIIIAFP